MASLVGLEAVDKSLTSVSDNALNFSTKSRLTFRPWRHGYCKHYPGYGFLAADLTLVQSANSKNRCNADLNPGSKPKSMSLF